MLLGRKTVINIGCFGDIADFLFISYGIGRNILAQDLYLSLVSLKYPQQNFYGRTFSCSIWADITEDLSPLNFKIDSVEWKDIIKVQKSSGKIMTKYNQYVILKIK